MHNKINIAIDGPAASGKSAAASLLSKKINYQFMDTGIMYRSFTNFCLKNNVSFENKDLIISKLKFFNIKWNNNNFLFNNQIPTEEIYNKQNTNNVALIASLFEVRKFMVLKIQKIVKNKGFIVVGRDISSIVLPNAQLKIFLTSSLYSRCERRYKQYIKEDLNITRKQVYDDIIIRDNIDKNRKNGQLIIVKDAIILNNSNYNLQTTVDKLKILYDNYFITKKSKF